MKIKLRWRNKNNCFWKLKQHSPLWSWFNDRFFTVIKKCSIDGSTCSSLPTGVAGSNYQSETGNQFHLLPLIPVINRTPFLFIGPSPKKDLATAMINSDFRISWILPKVNWRSTPSMDGKGNRVLFLFQLTTSGSMNVEMHGDTAVVYHVNEPPFNLWRSDYQRHLLEATGPPSENWLSGSQGMTGRHFVGRHWMWLRILWLSDFTDNHFGRQGLFWWTAYLRWLFVFAVRPIRQVGDKGVGIYPLSGGTWRRDFLSH